MRMKVFSMMLIGLLLVSATNEKLIKVKLDDKVTIFIPEGFTPMTPEDMAQRYESYRRPLALYTDRDRLVDFGVNRAYSIWQEDDLETMMEFYQASIMELYDKVDFIDSGIKTVHKQQFVYFEFESIVYPENDFQGSISKYTYLMYALSDGTTFLFNFTCPRNMRQQWQPTVNTMMSKIKLK